MIQGPIPASVWFTSPDGSRLRPCRWLRRLYRVCWADGDLLASPDDRQLEGSPRLGSSWDRSTDGASISGNALPSVEEAGGLSIRGGDHHGSGGGGRKRCVGRHPPASRVL